MRLALEGNLPFVPIRVGYRGTEIEIGKVLILCWRGTPGIPEVGPLGSAMAKFFERVRRI